jgi:hypothetical protein
LWDWNLAFSNNGQHGYAVAIGRNQTGTTVDPFNLGYFYTSDFGSSWDGPFDIILDDFETIANELPPGYIATSCFEVDLAIDLNGFAHCLLTVSAMDADEYIDELVYNTLYDFVINDESVDVHKISGAQTYQNLFGVSPNTNYMNSRPQVSRSTDGSKVFFFWLDSDSLLTGSSANSLPNLMGCAYNTYSDSFTDAKNFTENTSYDGQIIYSTVSPIAIEDGLNYEIPVVFAELSPSQLLTDPVFYHYIDNVIFEFEETQCLLPQGWDYTITNSIHTISIPVANVPILFDGPIEVNDWIGVFFIDDGGIEICAGAVQWNGVSNIAISAYGDDPLTPEKDGFDSGEQFRWKIFDCDFQTSCDAFATYDNSLPQSSGVFLNMGLSSLESLQCQVCQEFILSENWNDLSLFIDPFDPLVEDVFSPMANDLIIMRNLTNLYWPQFNINTIENWDINSGYVVKMLTQNELTICGLPLSINDIELTSAPSSWHYLPSISPCEVSTTEIFGSHVDDIVIVKDLLGSNVWWPQFDIYSLSHLIPGQSYEIKLTNDVLFTFPECSKMKTAQIQVQANFVETYWGILKSSPISHTVALLGNHSGEFTNGDQIGVFNQQGKCYGAVEIQGEKLQSLSLYGDDPTTHEKDGFTENEPLEFRLWKAETGEEFLLDVTFDQSMPNPDVVFNTHGLSAISDLRVSSTRINNIDENTVRIFPNPTRDKVYIQLSKTGTATISVFDITGQQLLSNSFVGKETEIDLSSFESGIYLIEVKGENILKIDRLIKN